MAQSREQQILAKATPRPWTVTHKYGSNVFVQAFELRGMFGGKPDIYPIFQKDTYAIDGGIVFASPNDMGMIALAVNSYEADQELIRKLTDAIGNFVCTSCDHPLRLHLDEYGCEQEGPDIAGNEGVPAHASGPCGCVGGSPAEDALIEALKAAREGAKHVG